MSEYLKHVIKRIHEEEERLDFYLDISTSKKLIAVTDTCFISNYLDTIIGKGFVKEFLVDQTVFQPFFVQMNMVY